MTPARRLFPAGQRPTTGRGDRASRRVIVAAAGCAVLVPLAARGETATPGGATSAGSPDPGTVTVAAETDLLTVVYRLETILVSLSRDILLPLGDDDLPADDPAALRGLLRDVLDQDRQHREAVAELASSLGVAVAEPGPFTFTGRTVDEHLANAVRLKEVAVGAYGTVVQGITDPTSRTAMIGLLASEARHESVYASHLTGASPVGDAFELPLPLGEMERQLRTLVTGL